MPNESFTFADELPPKSEPKQPPSDAQRLLDWLQKWPHPTVRMNQILVYGPASIRKKERALEPIKVLVDRGWLTPRETRRPDMLEWQIERRPIVHPTIAT
jgi:hypothetical protein